MNHTFVTPIPLWLTILGGLFIMSIAAGIIIYGIIGYVCFIIIRAIYRAITGYEKPEEQLELDLE